MSGIFQATLIKNIYVNMTFVYTTKPFEMKYCRLWKEHKNSFFSMKHRQHIDYVHINTGWITIKRLVILNIHPAININNGGYQNAKQNDKVRYSRSTAKIKNKQTNQVSFYKKYWKRHTCFFLTMHMGPYTQCLFFLSWDVNFPASMLSWGYFCL